jgi:hypothetical protein
MPSEAKNRLFVFDPGVFLAVTEAIIHISGIEAQADRRSDSSCVVIL